MQQAPLISNFARTLDFQHYISGVPYKQLSLDFLEYTKA